MFKKLVKIVAEWKLVKTILEKLRGRGGQNTNSDA